jgi:hypothetical protein
MNEDTRRRNDPKSAYLREALLDLAYDVSSYLRQSARKTVRVSAALLIAASLAACGPGAPNQIATSAAVQPLAQEIRQGLPTQPGLYSIVPNTLGRDAQGVYHFAWRRPGDPAGAQTQASASLLRLAQGATPQLVMPGQGDPILMLPPDASVPLVDTADALLAGNAYSSGYYPMWHPFYGGGYRGIGYYDPPTRSVSTNTSVDGSTVSTSPAPAAQRVVGLSRAVSGQAGGTGSGVAATNKSGASTSTTNHGGAAAAKSSSFSSGTASSSSSSSSS